MTSFTRMVRGSRSLVVGAALCGGVARGQDIHIDIQSYDVAVGQDWAQASAAAPVQASGNAYRFSASVRPTLDMWVNSLTVKSPAGASYTLAKGDGDAYEYTEAMALATAFTAKYALGAYNYSFDTSNDGQRTVVLSLSGGSYPAAPQVSNWTEAQSVDPDQDFDLRWNAFAGAGPNDAIRLVVKDADGSEVLDTGDPTTSDALSGTETSYTIYSGYLESGRSYNGYLTFYKMVQKATDPSGFTQETGYAMLYRRTQFTLHAGGGGSTGSDTTPPTLSASYPLNNATMVSSLTPMILSFSEPMAATQAIEWSSNIDPAKVKYTWQQPDTLMVAYGGGADQRLARQRHRDLEVES